MLKTFPASGFITTIKSQTELIVGEAKTSTTNMEAQLRKYLSSNFNDGSNIGGSNILEFKIKHLNSSNSNLVFSINNKGYLSIDSNYNSIPNQNNYRLIKVNMTTGNVTYLDLVDNLYAEVDGSVYKTILPIL